MGSSSCLIRQLQTKAARETSPGPNHCIGADSEEKHPPSERIPTVFREIGWRIPHSYHNWAFGRWLKQAGVSSELWSPNTTQAFGSIQMHSVERGIICHCSTQVLDRVQSHKRFRQHKSTKQGWENIKISNRALLRITPCPNHLWVWASNNR